MKRVIVTVASLTLTGAMLVLALPPSGIWPLGFIAFVPLFIAVRGQGFAIGVLGALLACMFAGFLASSGVLYEVRDPEGESGWTYLGFFLFGATAAIIGAILSESRSVPRWSSLLLASVAVAAEGLLLLELPAHLALTASRTPLFLTLASWGGIWLASWTLWWANLEIARKISAGRVAYAPLAFLLAAYGSSLLPWPVAEGDAVTVAALTSAETTLEELMPLHRQASDAGALLVVWPEGSGTGICAGGNTIELRNEIYTSAAAMVASFYDDQTPSRNVATLVTNQGESVRYYKRKLFGSESEGHSAGDAPAAAEFGGFLVGLNVCFDSCFPAVMRETARIPNVRIIALPTLDPASPHGFIEAIHAAFTPFRAAELGIPIIRAEAARDSMIVDGGGRIVAELQKGPGVLIASVTPERRWTLYRQVGDVWLYLCGFVTLASLVVITARSFQGSRHRS